MNLEPSSIEKNIEKNITESWPWAWGRPVRIRVTRSANGVGWRVTVIYSKGAWCPANEGVRCGSSASYVVAVRDEWETALHEAARVFDALDRDATHEVKALQNPPEEWYAPSRLQEAFYNMSARVKENTIPQGSDFRPHPHTRRRRPRTPRAA